MIVYSYHGIDIIVRRQQQLYTSINNYKQNQDVVVLSHDRTWHSFFTTLGFILLWLNEWSSSSLSVKILIERELSQALEFLQW
jgi:predicted nuclease of predicted toxin-antitoxin system